MPDGWRGVTGFDRQVDGGAQLCLTCQVDGGAQLGLACQVDVGAHFTCALCCATYPVAGRNEIAPLRHQQIDFSVQISTKTPYLVKKILDFGLLL